MLTARRCLYKVMLNTDTSWCTKNKQRIAAYFRAFAGGCRRPVYDAELEVNRHHLKY